MQLANYKNKELVAKLLFDMYMEVSPDLVTVDFQSYLTLANSYITDADVWLNDDLDSFFIVRNEATVVMLEPIWNGIAVYIAPNKRKSKQLQLFYSHLFNNYKGTIMGYTDVNSEHNKVLQKRHSLLGYVYALTT